MTAPTKIDDLPIGSPQWLRVVSASKIAAVVGLSNYESRYSLWHLMAGNVEPQANNAILQRGHYLEPAIAAWFADQLQEDDRLDPTLSVVSAATYIAAGNPRHVASPDRILTKDVTHRQGKSQWSTTTRAALLELKSGQNDWEWGETGSDDIPIGYRCQVQWQLHVMDLDVCYVACITSRLEFRWYRIERDQDDINYLIAAADAFLASLDAGVEPDVDGSGHTYAAIRELHPDIDGTTVELDPATAAEWVEVIAAEKRAHAAKQDVQNRIAHLMGSAQYAALDNTIYARRQTRKGTNPFVVAPAGLIERQAA